MKENLVFAVLAFIIFSVSLASAQALIIGKIYSEGYSETVSGADVTVICNSAKNTNSLEDGTYAVKFDISICSLGSSVKVSATKGDLYGESTGTIVQCDNGNCVDSEYLAVLNLMIKDKPTTPTHSSSSSSGGSVGRTSYLGYFNCGNNICDTGENDGTCPKDCAKKTSENGLIELGLNQNQETTNQTDKKKTSGSGITGAIIGFGRSSAGIGLVAIIILLIIIILIAIARRAGRSY